MDNIRKNTRVVIVAGVLVILFAILMAIFFRLNLVGALIMGWLLTFFYAIFAFIMLREYSEQGAKIEVRELIKEVQKPVYVDRPVDRPIYVDKPVYVEKKVYVDKPVYIEKKRKKLNIPKYNFLASTETKTYHTRNCRLGKLIKRKYKLSSNSKRVFIRKRFKACKVCIKKQKKI